MPRLPAIVYSRPGCHLCEEAEALLLRHGLSVSTIDIDAKAELLQRYDTCVPVVFINGKERFRGRVDERLLVRLLRQEAESGSPKGEE